MLGQKRTADRAFVADKWSAVKNAVTSLLTGQRSSVSFQYVYQCVFQLVQAKQGQELSQTLAELFSAHIRTIVVSIETTRDDTFLEVVTEQLKQYRLALEKLDSVLLFYNRAFAATFHKPTAHQLGEALVGESLFANERFLARLHAQFHVLFGDARHWTSITAYFYEIVLLEAGKWMKAGFEEPFLAALIRYYTTQSCEQPPGQTVGQYLEWAFSAVSGETDRADVLNAGLADLVQDALENVLISQQKYYILKGPGGIDERLRAWDVAGLHPLVHALGRVDEEDAATEEIIRAVAETVRKIFDTSSRPPSTRETIDSIVVLLDNVQSIASMMKNGNDRARVLRTIKDTLNADPELPELLSRFVDYAMRTTTGEVLNSLVDRAITVFKALRDKDVFEVSYRNYLAARLVHATPEMIRAEKGFIAKLNEDGGAACMARLDGMLADVEASSAVNKRIADEIQAGTVTLPIEFQIAVLTTAFWPTIPATVMRLPHKMETCQSFFRDHYLRRHNGRQLLFNFNSGSVILSLRMPQKVYTVVAPTLYVHTLLALNSDEDITPASLMDLSLLPQSELASQLAVLEQLGLAVQSTGGTYHFNKQFNSPSLRVKVSPAIMAKTAAFPVSPSARHSGGLESTRNSHIDASIVKWLKREKTLPHDALCAHVVNDLKHIFTPTMPGIKNRLTSLIERGFITRSAAPGYYIYCQ